jgi:hydroxyacylglutathione hydrolase
MKLFTVKSEGLAHNSYLLIDGGEAVVFDPRRDCKIYSRLTRKKCAKIKYIFETHRNEDYVVGSQELQNITNAEIAHGKQLAFQYGEHNLVDEDTFSFGKIKVRALHTPGHTNESFCYAIINTEKSADPLMVFSGDTLFVGSIGRTDLQGEKERSTQSEKLYTSIHEKLLPLGKQVLLYPAHGSGSVCGSGIGEQEISTIGYEEKTNSYLKLNKEDFVRRALTTEMIIPVYFRKMEEYNLRGAPGVRGLPPPKGLNVSDFESEANESDSEVVDTRMPNAFAGSHIPNSLSIWLLGGTAVYTGWVLDYEKRVLLVAERKKDVERVKRHFWRLGFDNFYGYLCPGMDDWQDKGKPISKINTLSASALHDRSTEYVVLDVREPSEWHEEGVVQGAKCIFFADIPEKAKDLDRDKRYAVICSVGKRASIASSMLKRMGFADVGNVLGGITAWRNLGYPTEKRKTK